MAADSMERGSAAIRRFVATAREFGASPIVAVATSAVRDAANGALFATNLREQAGIPVRILTGEEEANYIGRGLACDPALAGAADFNLFDLGGGSLECVEFRSKRATQEASLRLGCVRLTERCVADPATPFSPADREAVETAVADAFAAGAFKFTLAAAAPAVATGGTVTTVRAMLAAAGGVKLDESVPVVSVSELEELLTKTGVLPLPLRHEIPGLPAARADVFPTALATMIAVARIARVDRFTHSFYNLRYGVAEELISHSGPCPWGP